MSTTDEFEHRADNQAIAVLGGSFDPVHFGHLWMAQASLEQLPVQQVYLIPTATSPLKPDGPVANNQQRLDMLRLAISGASELVIDPWELRQDEISYTLRTLRHLSEQSPKRSIYLVIGSDSLASFDRWHRPAEVLKQSHLCVIARGGHPKPDYSVLRSMSSESEIAAIAHREIQMPQIELSSTEIRERVRRGDSIRFLVPAPVAALIQSDGLYC